MPSRSFIAILPLLLTFQFALAQQAPSRPAGSVFTNKATPDVKTSEKMSASSATATEADHSLKFSARKSVDSELNKISNLVSRGPSTLPNEHGQIWRKYDIRPYTSRLKSIDQPQQALVDWIIRETGTQVWFSEPLGFFNTTRDTLSVYHTPQMQETIADLVERFINGKADSYAFGIKLLTVRSPNWRAKAYKMMQPVEVQTAGIEAWLLSKENAAVLLSDLRKRTDYREHQMADIVIPNGQVGALSMKRPQSYMKAVHHTQRHWSDNQLEMAQIDAGFSLELSPLLSQDGNIVDAEIRCKIDQVERLIPVLIDTPTGAVPRQRIQIQVPQLVSWRLHERFRWPRNQVLLLSCGVVATPSEGRSASSFFPNSMKTGFGRADGLLVIDCKGKLTKTRETTRSVKINSLNRY